MDSAAWAGRHAGRRRGGRLTGIGKSALLAEVCRPTDLVAAASGDDSLAENAELVSAARARLAEIAAAKKAWQCG